MSRRVAAVAARELLFLQSANATEYSWITPVKGVDEAVTGSLLITYTSKMRPQQKVKTPGRHRPKQQSCPQFLRSTWPTIHSEEDMAPNDMIAFLAAVRAKGFLPIAYSTELIRYASEFHIERKSGRKSRPSSRPSSRTSSTPILRSLGDTDDTEDEGFSHRCRLTSFSSVGSNEPLRQATSMGSLTSSYSSLGEPSSCTSDESVFKRALSSTSLQAILDPYFNDSDYDHDPRMREAVEDIVSPKPVKSKPTSVNDVPTSGFAAMDPSILVALPARGTEEEKPKYTATNLCDLSDILSCPAPAPEIVDARTDLALLRVGTMTVDTDELDGRPGWDIPTGEEPDDFAEEMSRIPYRKLSETSESGEECFLLSRHNVSLDLSSDSSTTSRSRSSSLSSAHDSSDYLADISSEETGSGYVTMWPPANKFVLHVEEDKEPFVLSPRIPGVDYYGVPSSDLKESPERVSLGVSAFFASRSIVHRLGPHGTERVYDEETCPGGCGFMYPVPPREVPS